MRSIPAYAGEPAIGYSGKAQSPVYPRVCGGTYRDLWVEGLRHGLSPRMRGNLSDRLGNGDVARSIPAYAGEPLMRRHRKSGVAVYPRVCGGTKLFNTTWTSSEGLSPRMRGNPRAGRMGAWACRSIPAYAGEPSDKSFQRGVFGVYPRVCGGTLPGRPAIQNRLGLSPRMRGNQRGADTGRRRSRSIPAYAGEPQRAATAAHQTEVYPRVCGGTNAAQIPVDAAAGLSPRMRGNPSGRRQRHTRQRSIPAYAGEPPPCRVSVTSTTVYPRVCGGTPKRNPCGKPA